ncbi:MAG: deoxyribodipyrimidine photo-lyase [Candidatus Rifleibacteriota bacterium]
MRSLVWFRRDLRISDNPALHHACRDSEQVIALYFTTPKQWQLHNEAECKINFWIKNLQSLKTSLEKLKIPLQVISLETYEEVPAKIEEIACELNCDRLYYNYEYEPKEKRRDEQSVSRLQKRNIKAFGFHDRLIIDPGKVLTGSNKPYLVFTPYRNKWAKIINAEDLKTFSSPETQKNIKNIKSSTISTVSFSQNPLIDKLWPAGENSAQKFLSDFLHNKISDYDKDRDIPAIDGTSRLSPYLAAGVISPRQCLEQLLEIRKNKVFLPDFSTSAGTWVNELIWREFYNNILIEFPRVGKELPFKLNTEKIAWSHNQEHLEAWQNGLTGYPIVDAAMRQLKETGWMHNRLRMIAAMFLSKHLLLDWRLGEAWFMKNLIDGDLASNNGGWQWSASTGTDSVPYFRVFNPFRQSQKFDKNGEFIKKYCPELENCSARSLHDPKLLAKEIKTKGVEYPEPLVEHSTARKKAISRFKNLHQ